MHADDLRRFLSEQLQVLVSETGHDVGALFGDHVVDDFAELPARLAHAAGCIEGAALALGVTVLEMLDELGIAE